MCKRSMRIVTALEMRNLPVIWSLLYRKVNGPHVRLAQDLVIPLSGGVPIGPPIGEIMLKPTEKTHRLAYRAILRDAVARRIRQLGGLVDRKNAELCGVRIVYDVTLSGDKRMLMAFPQGDVNPTKAISVLHWLLERLKYIVVANQRVYLKGPVSLDEIRGGKFPEPPIEILNENYEQTITNDPLKPFMEGRGRAIEGGVDFGKKVRIRLISDDQNVLKKLSEFMEVFLYGIGQRQGYIELMRTEAEIVGERLAEPHEAYRYLSPGDLAFIVFSKESRDIYRNIRKASVRMKAVTHMLKLESLNEFYEAVKRGKTCGIAALAIDVHKKLGFLPYRLEKKSLERLFRGNVSHVYGLTQLDRGYALVRYSAEGKFEEFRFLRSIAEAEELLEEGSIVYSQGVRELTRRNGAVLYIDRRTPVGIIENFQPARGAFFFTPREAFVVAGYNCRTLRVRLIRTRNYRPYSLAAYTYWSSRLLQRDFPILVPPVIRALDRIREHVSNGIIGEKIAQWPRFLRVPCLSLTPSG